MKLVLAIEIDEEKATAYNASLFDPEHDDPVLGDGRALVRDVVADCGIDELLGDGLKTAIVSFTATLDDETLPYHEWPR